MNIHPSLCILFRAKARIECATCEASSHNGNSACQFLKLAHVFDFRVQSYSIFLTFPLKTPKICIFF